jgi:hypothetical protein
VLHEELSSLPDLPEVEWTRLRALEFQDLLRQRGVLRDRLVKMGCQLCPDFEEHVSGQAVFIFAWAGGTFVVGELLACWGWREQFYGTVGIGVVVEDPVDHRVAGTKGYCDTWRNRRWLVPQYETLHERKTVEASLTQLKLALSDQNLELLPDYESRVEVLKRLHFIDENATVLLKGRVACEVSGGRFWESELARVIVLHNPKRPTSLGAVVEALQSTAIPLLSLGTVSL